MNVDHDGLFKKLLTTFFAEFIELFFPEIHSLIDYSSLKFLSQELITDVTEGEKHYIDILAEVEIKGENGYVLIHIEPQSYRQKNFNRRMFKYFCRLHEKHNKKILPIALFSHNRLANEDDSYEISFPFLKVIRFEYLKIQLKQISWQTYIKNNNPVAAALLSKMNYQPKEKVQVKYQFLRMLIRLCLDPARSTLLTGFFENYCVLTEKEEQELQQKVVQELTPKEVLAVMEITTSWHEKGRLEGISKILIKQSQKRFGTLPPDILGKIKELSVEQLDTLAERILEVASLDELRQAVNSLN